MILCSNVYLSLCRSKDIKLMRDVLAAAKRGSQTSLVGAFTDTVYGRSSLHFTSTDKDSLQGTINNVISVAELGYCSGPPRSSSASSSSTSHPSFGGVIDNLSICQLEPRDGRELAREVAQGIVVEGEKVYYGWPGGEEYMRLKDIRKSSGWFESSKTHSRKVTVGVLSKFVSNYNVRVTLTGGEREGDAGNFLKRNVTPRVRDVKGGDGSVVEALTLRYRTEAEGECWEVACNLLHGGDGVGGAEGGVWGEREIMDVVEREVGKWEGGSVIKGYRVGLSEVEHRERTGVDGWTELSEYDGD